MKKTIYLLVAILTLSLFVGCEKDDNALQNKITRSEWILTSVNGIDAPDGLAVYAAFSGSSFELYQKAEQPYYEKYTGHFSFSGSVISGTYSDGQSWGGSYTVEFNSDGTTMTWTNTQDEGEVQVYTQTTIPEDVKSGATVVDATRAGEFRIF